jgi:hypothetical protein
VQRNHVFADRPRKKVQKPGAVDGVRPCHRVIEQSRAGFCLAIATVSVDFLVERRPPDA